MALAKTMESVLHTHFKSVERTNGVGGIVIQPFAYAPESPGTLTRPHSDFSFAAGYSRSNVTCTSFISAISVMTIARVPLRSNTIPFARTYLPTKGISFCR